jgi:hypothetical protein
MKLRRRIRSVMGLLLAAAVVAAPTEQRAPATVVPAEAALVHQLGCEHQDPAAFDSALRDFDRHAAGTLRRQFDATRSVTLGARTRADTGGPGVVEMYSGSIRAGGRSGHHTRPPGGHRRAGYARSRVPLFQRAVSA